MRDESTSMICYFKSIASRGLECDSEAQFKPRLAVSQVFQVTGENVSCQLLVRRNVAFLIVTWFCVIVGTVA